MFSDLCHSSGSDWLKHIHVSTPVANTTSAIRQIKQKLIHTMYNCFFVFSITDLITVSTELEYSKSK